MSDSEIEEADLRALEAEDLHSSDSDFNSDTDSDDENHSDSDSDSGMCSNWGDAVDRHVQCTANSMLANTHVQVFLNQFQSFDRYFGRIAFRHGRSRRQSKQQGCKYDVE